MRRRHSLLSCAAIVLLWAGIARAQSAPTCAFDPTTARVTVSVDGLDARLQAVASSGEIWLNGVWCAGATIFNTDSIQVNGGTRGDEVTLGGTFAPGLTPEATGGSEIEISFALGTREAGGGYDMVVVNLSPQNDWLMFMSDGIDIGNDGDADILRDDRGSITVNGQGGNDHIDASAYGGDVHPAVVLHGGPGRDVLIGSTVEGSNLYGEDGDDVLIGGDSRDLDRLFGGMGDDRMVGNGGPDTFYSEATVDGADDMRGGDGIDWVSYGFSSWGYRTNAVTVTIGDSEPDGEPGEGDLVHGDIENVAGGHGPNVLVGNGRANVLQGWNQDDELYGGGGNDILYGGPGNDILSGDGGDDVLSGGDQNDSLSGGLGADRLNGENGADILQGGPGADMLDGGDGADEFYGDGGKDTFVNDDAYAETVDCGAGAGDDPQPSSLDTFIGCELI